MRRVDSSASESHDKVGSVGANAAEPAGKAALPSAPLFSLLSRLSRREFLVLTGIAALATLPGCGSSGSSSPQSTRTAYRLSGRGRRISQAAKKHNANMLFTTEAVAREHRAHPGDTSRVVRIEVSREFHSMVFGGRDVADLRHAL